MTSSISQLEISQGSKSSSPSSFSRKVEVALVLSLAVLATLLRLHGLSEKSFWIDEGTSIAIARLDAWNFLRILWRREANMSLYYLLLRGWLHLGTSEVFIRGLSVIFSVATVPVVYLLGKKLFSSSTGLFAALLLAVNAYHVRYAQEARSYSLVVFLITLASLYFVDLLHRPSRRHLIGYITSGVLAVYSHFFGALTLLAQWISLKLSPSAGTITGREGVTRAARRILGWTAPIALFILTTGMGPMSWISRPTWAGLYYFFLLLTGLGGPVLLAAYTVSVLLGVFRVFSKRRAGSGEAAWSDVFLLTCLFLPIIVTVSVSFMRPVFIPRYLVICLTPLALMAGASLASIRPRMLAFPILALMVAMSLRGDRLYYRQPIDIGLEDWRGATHYILANADSGDAVIFHNALGRTVYDYYLSQNKQTTTQPVVVFPGNGKSLTYKDFMGNPSPAMVAGLDRHYDRIWLVLSHIEDPPKMDPLTRAMDAVLRLRYTVQSLNRFDGIDVALYSKNPGTATPR